MIDTIEAALFELGCLSGEYEVELNRMSSMTDDGQPEPIENAPIINIWIRERDEHGKITRGMTTMSPITKETDNGYVVTGEYYIRGETITPPENIKNPPTGFNTTDSGDVMCEVDNIGDAIERSVEISEYIRESQFKNG